MEYLMTYGWAILVVLIALGALFYLGVFSPSTPNTCTATAPFTCADVKADATSDDVVISVGASGIAGWSTFSDFTINSPQGYECYNLDLAVPIGEGDSQLGLNMEAANLTSSIQSITCYNVANNELNSGDKLIGTALVNYTLSGSTQTHSMNVQFSGTVEA